MNGTPATAPRVEQRPETTPTTPSPEPMFRRYQIKVKAGVRMGALPTGHPPIGY